MDCINSLAALIVGAAAVGLIGWAFGIRMRAQKQAELTNARKFLENRGYSTYLYLPSTGVDDPATRKMLDIVAQHGYVVQGRENRILGGFLSNAQPGKNHLRLVVDNSESDR